MRTTLIERAVALTLLLALLPVLVVAVAAVRLDSRGAAIYRQERIGHRGRAFVLLKLRTMHVGAHRQRALVGAAGAALHFKRVDDPRITRVGRWLRRTSLDETLQLVNVVRGEMRLVGPRPALPEEAAAFDDAAWERCRVMPGMTGLWQVSGRSELTWHQALALDLDYVRRRSVWLDLQILARTPAAVLRRRGAW